MHPPNMSDQHMSVLVVDNDQDGANSTADLLNIYGYTAQAVYSADDAIAAAAAHHPDAVITDACLHGADVHRLAEQLRRVCPRNPLMVAITGLVGADEDCRKAGFDHFFLKPAEPATLKDILSAHESAVKRYH